ncbi:MAG: energy-coupling factor transporter transmembrane protein EcfT [Chloroflexi bacterium]|mgnify:CR=1 FL=1|nr:energy-coupling factor transporter transmembrane protein EcfT [Chloroflexota bacterium]
MILHILGLAESLMNYEPSDRFLHRLNPLTKMAIFLVVVIGGMYISSPTFPWWLSFLMTVALVLLAVSGGVPLKKELQLRGGYVLAIVLVIFLGNLIFARGGEADYGTGQEPAVYLSIPPFIYISSISLNFAVAKTLFILNSIIIVIIILKSTRLSDLSHSMQTVGVPYPVAMLTSTSLRCVPMVTDGLLIVYNAQRARGFEMDKGSIGARLRQWKALLTPLMLVLLKWVDLMSIVFQSRGLDFTSRPRTRLRRVPFGPADAVITFVALGGMVAFIVLHRMGTFTFQLG